MCSMKRGALLVFEGCDRTGKSTQCDLLIKNLESSDVKVKQIKFPERNSPTGKIIDSYLKSVSDLSNEAIHLLFSANRWELKQQMLELLESGTTLVVDRYSYSGVAYSWAKGLSYDWCMAPEKGLIRPDAVFYLKADVESLQGRDHYGQERYEKADLQRKVSDNFDTFYQNEKRYWHKVDAGSPIEVVSGNVLRLALDTIRKAESQPLKFLD